MQLMKLTSCLFVLAYWSAWPPPANKYPTADLIDSCEVSSVELQVCGGNYRSLEFLERQLTLIFAGDPSGRLNFYLPGVQTTTDTHSGEISSFSILVAPPPA